MQFPARNANGAAEQAIEFIADDEKVERRPYAQSRTVHIKNFTANFTATGAERAPKRTLRSS
jgi:hypothetical protein